uniref:Uncharacterized protein n=1 Tax=Ditylum brightwellii TaxID=49249 RepID=A0A6U3TPH6_9STRA|mmetsp:Transcript_38337/g.57407  ORF Transcript_38337/g.57407 Transcript_38337/m.57407 type:complete len:155 (+) Transcript_38337:199-663(+)
MMFPIAFYGGLCLFAVIYTSVSMYHHPFVPPDRDNVDWLNSWLMTTAIQYYTGILCLCGVVFTTEPQLWAGLLWCIGILTLGSPMCCFWIVIWFWRGGTLTLARKKERNRLLEGKTNEDDITTEYQEAGDNSSIPSQIDNIQSSSASFRTFGEA